MNINDNVTTSESQNKQITDYLLSGKRLTQLEALNLFGCMRLASRVHDIRERGIDVKMDKVILSNGKRVAQYFV